MSEISEILPVQQCIVVDNDDTTLFLCKAIIQRTFENVGITTYNSPGKALDYFTNALKANPVTTLVMLDINMPEISGWEVLESINLLDAEVKDKFIIFIHSASVDTNDKIKAINYPLVVGYLEKPLTRLKMEEIITKINSELIS